MYSKQPSEREIREGEGGGEGGGGKDMEDERLSRMKDLRGGRGRR